MSSEFLILMKQEMGVTLILFILLFLKIWDGIKDNGTLLKLIHVLLLLNFLSGFVWNQNGELFNGMFATNSLRVMEKSVLNLGTLIISMQAYDYLKSHKHLLEFFMLLLSTLLGMFFMISSNNLLMFYLGLELSSIPLAAMVNFDLDKIKSSEAAVKMILSSAFASSLMLFGISFLYGTTGTLNFQEIVSLITGSPLQVFALLLVFSGFAFKLSAVPFHLWTADVYEGSPVAVTSYLSVISKAAMVFVTLSSLAPLFTHINELWYHLLFVTIILTITIGNIFAIRQDNIKRFLAFSSISQVGFILLGISSGTTTGASAAIYFLVVYIFSNLGAFGVIALVSAQTGKEQISDYKGFYKTNPLMSWVLALSLFSLGGIPPTAGFFGKMFLVTAGASKGNYLLITIAALNMVISLYYYLRVVKAVFMDENPQPVEALKGSLSVRLALLICMMGVIGTGFAGGFFEHIYQLAAN